MKFRRRSCPPPKAFPFPAGSSAAKTGLWPSGGIPKMEPSIAAETSSGVGKANDAAENSEGTWLAVEGRGAPFKFTGGTALPGSGEGKSRRIPSRPGPPWSWASRNPERTRSPFPPSRA